MKEIKNLNTRYMGRKIMAFEVLDSTNTTAKENSHMPEGTVIIADRQLKGRGRRDRKWHSDDGGALYFSVILKPRTDPENLSRITLIAGISLAKAVGAASGLDVEIKWPNDLIINSKKAAGILTELSIKDDEKCVILGIGVNVENAKFPDEISEIATSVRIESGKEIKKEEILKSFLEGFEKDYESFLESGFSAFKNFYEKSCITVGKEIRVITPTDEYQAFSVGISDNGELIIRKDNEIITLNSGEVSVRGIY